MNRFCRRTTVLLWSRLRIKRLRLANRLSKSRGVALLVSKMIMSVKMGLIGLIWSTKPVKIFQ